MKPKRWFLLLQVQCLIEKVLREYTYEGEHLLWWMLNRMKYSRLRTLPDLSDQEKLSDYVTLKECNKNDCPSNYRTRRWTTDKGKESQGMLMTLRVTGRPDDCSRIVETSDSPRNAELRKRICQHTRNRTVKFTAITAWTKWLFSAIQHKYELYKPLSTPKPPLINWP